MENTNSVQSILETVASEWLNAGDDSGKEVYRIGDLAREFGVSLRTLRFYEDRGLISPARSGSTRIYSPEDRTRLKVILLAKNVGFSLVDIQDVLKIYDSSNADEGFAKICSKFDEQLETLQYQKKEIERSILDLTGAIETLGKLK